MLRHMTHGCGSDRGAAAVEFALVLPMLLVLVLGITQFGLTFTQWLQMEHAAREGARWGSLGYSVSVIEAKVQEAAPGLDWTAPDAEISVDPNDPPNHAGQPITVKVTYSTPVLPIVGVILQWTGSTKQLTATAVNRIE